ncbi:hypothetical protein NC653_019949 [Populus alba x Populus x berolinensis]|uniref:Uncharacterized protein n=1 Tax=Populus alba x Populus x berolinensis TaxID=444605 RepID=A0AAD6MJN7_9ROSI|nr:hypothetical protein NC653_019949 [Populus alba x Populus x berolinensis]
MLWFSALLRSVRWARRGDVWEAADLKPQMKQEGVHPDIHTFTSPYKCLLQGWRHADLRNRRSKPSAKLYTRPSLLIGMRITLPRQTTNQILMMKPSNGGDDNLFLAGLHPQDEPSNQVEISSSSSSQRSCMSIDINSTDSCDMIEAPSLVLTLPHPIYGV